MLTLLLLGGAAVVLVALASGGEGKSSSISALVRPQGLPPAQSGPSNPNKQTTLVQSTQGGVTWKTQVAATDGLRKYIDVFAPAGTFGPHKEFLVLRYVETNSDPTSRLFVESPPGTDPSVMQRAMVDFQLKTPTELVSTSPGQPTSLMAPNTQARIAAVLQALGVGAGGTIERAPDVKAVQAATALAAELEKAGFSAAAATIRSYAKQAAAMIPPPENQIPLPGVDPAMVEKINRAIQLERDPARLRALVGALKELPQSQQRDDLISALEAAIAQIEAKQAQAETLERVHQILVEPPPVQPASVPSATLPGTYVVKQGDTGSSIAKAFTGNPNRWPELVKANPKTKAPAPLGFKAYAGQVIKLPANWSSTIPDGPTSVPVVPSPQAIPQPKSALEMLASQVALNLKAVQGQFGLKGSKGKEDRSLVARFQSAVGSKADGLAGPGTFISLAKAGVADLPYVEYWPKSATASTVLQYRDAIRKVAALERSGGDLSAASQLEASALRERGQSGIVGTMPV